MLFGHELVDIDELEEVLIKFEIQAKEANYNNFEGYRQRILVYMHII